MMIERLDKRVALLVALAVTTSLGFGCEGVDNEPQTSKPAAARPPVHVTDEPLEEEPETEETPEEETPKADEGVEVTWFKGVDNLPEAHPCHDSTTVIHATLQVPDERNGQGDPFDYEISTLGELRDELGPRWVHFGPRTARGVRWTHGGEEFVVATCNMGGVGYHSVEDVSFLEDEGIDMKKARDAKFVVGRVGEASSNEWGSLYRMRRTGPDARWTAVEQWGDMSNDDEGNDPQYVARARVIEAADSDGDKMPEVVAVTIQNRRSWEDKSMREDIYPDENPNHYCLGFELQILAREGGQVLTDRVILRLDGKHALTEKADKPDAMSDEVYETLRSQLDEHRDAAVSKARAILREDDKLR